MGFCARSTATSQLSARSERWHSARRTRASTPRVERGRTSRPTDSQLRLASHRSMVVALTFVSRALLFTIWIAGTVACAQQAALSTQPRLLILSKNDQLL